MTWKSFHRRGEILRTVIATADRRRDGLLPMDVDGVAETFGDELSLLGALQLRWHTHLAGRIERELMDQPMELERAVVTAWHGAATELPGIRAIIDHYRHQPLDEAMAQVMVRSAAKEHVLLAVMAGRVSAHDATAARVGESIEHTARATFRPIRPAVESSGNGLLDRIKSRLAA